MAIDKDLEKFNLEVQQASAKLEDLAKNFGKMEEHTRNMQKLFKKANDSIEDSAENIKECESNFDLLLEGVENFSRLFRSTPLTIYRNVKGIQQWADKMALIAKESKNFAGFLSKTGGLVAGLAKKMAPWVAGFSAIFNTVSSIDKYIKTLNKRFAEIRGPQIMTGDVTKQFKEFNKAVFSISDNIRDGLNADEVYNFLDALNAAGKRITTLNQGFFGYRDAVHIAARASNVFGTSLESVAKLMTDLNLNYRMDLDRIDDAFVKVAFDAQKSGLSTDKFWNAVINASASLSFYGKFIEAASKSMKVFTESQLAGVEETESVVTDVTQIFNKMTTQSAMAFSAIAKKGGASLRAMYRKVAERAKEEVIDIEAKLKAVMVTDPKNTEAIDQLRKELVAVEQKAARAEAAARGDQVAMAQEIAMLSADAPELLMNLMGGVNKVNLSTIKTGERMYATLKASADLAGLSEKDLRFMVGLVQSQVGLMEHALKDDKGFLKSLKKIQFMDYDQREELRTMTEDLKSLNENTNPDYINMVADRMSELLGIDKSQAKLLAQNSAYSSATKNFLTDLIGQAEEGNLNEEQAMKIFKDILLGGDEGRKWLIGQFKAEEASTETMEKGYNDTFNAIRDNKLSIDDMKKIVKDGALYGAAQLLYLQEISAGIAQIVTNTGDKKTSYAVQRALESLPEEIQKQVKKGNITAVTSAIVQTKESLKAQLEIQKNTEAFLDKLNESIKIEGMSADAIRDSYREQIKQFLSTKELPEDQIELAKQLLERLEALPDESLSRANIKAQIKLQKDISRKQQATTEGQLATAEDQLSKLTTIDSSTVDIANFTELGLMGNQEARDALLRLARERTGGAEVVSLRKLQKVVGGGRAGKLIEEMTTPWRVSGELIRFPFPLKPLKEKGDVKEVIRGGLVNISRGDIVVDKSSLARTLGGPPGSAIPLLKREVGKGAGSSMKIEINVNANNATAKEIAAAIDSRFRSLMYNMQVTGMV